MRVIIKANKAPRGILPAFGENSVYVPSYRSKRVIIVSNALNQQKYLSRTESGRPTIP